jgi:predicted nucleic acid-binding protein
MSVDELSGLFFLDTNVLVYSFDLTSPAKQKVAQQLISAALRTQRGLISTQVVQEFLNLALRKFARPFTVSECREYLKTVLLPLCQHHPNINFYDHALAIREETGYTLYDALVVAAAIEAGCAVLLSEDLHSGRNVRGLVIQNPFAA